MNFFRSSLAALFAAGLSLGAARAADPMLAGLEGAWKARGEVEGEAVVYRAEGRWVLGGAFLEFSMIDANEPPSYEASVFISRSKKKGDYVAHWLDVFGGDGARVVGFGEAEEDALVIEFPYPEATFRDRFDFAPDQQSFSLKIDSRAGDGPWEDFASYVFTRVEKE